MKRKYHAVNSGSKRAAKTIQNFCQANGQLLLPLADLISEARLAVDEVIDQAGHSLIETILTVRAAQVAGAKSLCQPIKRCARASKPARRCSKRC